MRMPIIIALLALAFFAVPGAPSVAAQDYVEGRHFQNLPTRVRTSDPRRIEVVHLLSYGAAGMKEFAPSFNNWAARQPRDVNVVLMPAHWNPVTQLHSQVFYTVQALGLDNRTHLAIIKGIHESALPFHTTEDIAAFFSRIGVDRARFNAAFSSFQVNSRTKMAENLGRGYRMAGVPEIVVNGMYRISPSMVGGAEQMLPVAEFLIQRIRAGGR